MMEQPKKARRHFDRQFKLDAVRLVEESTRPLAEIARELGVRDTVLHRWKREFASKADGGSTAGKASSSVGKSPEQVELEALRKKLAQVEEEREILKKAMAVFSRRPG